MIESISFVGSCLAIAGYSLRDISKFYEGPNDAVQDLRKIAQNELLKQTRSPAIIDDMLSGHWKLSSWEYTSRHLPNYSVNGSLSLCLKNATSNEWTGKMYLEYLHRASDPVDEVLRKKSPPFIASYDVNFILKDGLYSGDCHMTDKIEMRTMLGKIAKAIKFADTKQYEWRGEFINCELKGSGVTSKLCGHYFNKPKSPESSYADFEFHMRNTWGDLLSKLSNK